MSRNPVSEEMYAPAHVVLVALAAGLAGSIVEVVVVLLLPWNIPAAVMNVPWIMATILAANLGYRAGFARAQKPVSES